MKRFALILVPLLVACGDQPNNGTHNNQGVIEVASGYTRSATVPKLATGVELAVFDLTAKSHDIKTSSLTIHRGGVGEVTDWDSVYLHYGYRVNVFAARRTIDNATNSATFPLNLEIPAETTQTVYLLGDVTSDAGENNQHYFYINSAASIASTSVDVEGDFPVKRSTFTIGNATVNTVVIAQGPTSPNPSVGQKQAVIASFTITPGPSNDIALQSIKLFQAGNLSLLKELDEIQLYSGTEKLAWRVETTAISVDFNLGQFGQLHVQSGSTKTFTVRADIVGGLAGSIHLYLDDYDTKSLLVIDMQYGFGVGIDNQFTKTQAQKLTLQ